MSWSVEYTEEGLIEVVIVGRETFTDVIEETAAILAEMEGHRCYEVLVDCRRMRVALSTAEIYRVQDVYRELGVPLRTRFAVVRPAELPTHELHAYEFHELVSRNRGYHVRLFSEKNEALAWLGASAPESGASDNGKY